MHDEEACIGGKAIWMSTIYKAILVRQCRHLQMVAAGWALPAVLLARAAVGFGEGVVLPSMSNLMATRVPTSWRASALGLVYSGFHSGQSSSCACSS